MGADQGGTDKGQVGTNSRGNPIFEDENGVRSYTAKGVRVYESVNIISGQGASVDPSTRGDDYQTEAKREKKARRARAMVAFKRVVGAGVGPCGITLGEWWPSPRPQNAAQAVRTLALDLLGRDVGRFSFHQKHTVTRLGS